MRLIQFGCGLNKLKGWENYDSEVDISKKLLFENESVDGIFAEHVVEHLTSPDGYRFFKECFRILKKNGIVRICVPSIQNVFYGNNEDYLNWLMRVGFGDGTVDSAIENIIVNHGHLSLWTRELLNIALYAAGFRSFYYCEIFESKFPHMQNLEGHHRTIGLNAAKIESIVIEGIKC